jgi:hypothetical protein
MTVNTFLLSYILFLQKKQAIRNDVILGWRDVSAVKSTDCSFRGTEFKSQQPHGGSQPSAMRSDALFWCV